MEVAPRRELTLLDSTCLIVGIIIGAGIYRVAPDVARTTSSAWALGGLWLVGGILSLAGALSYAELATAYPQQGGDYVYLTRAYGPWAGFLFGWIQTVIVRPGDIAVMAFAFATYARSLYDPFGTGDSAFALQMYAAGAVLVLTALNIVGVSQGKWTQNVLTMAKVLGLVLIVAVALLAPASTVHSLAQAPVLPLSLGLILVLFTFGGWNEMVYVAAEVKEPNRNIVRALLLGTAAVTALYLLVNGAFIHALGYGGLVHSGAAASDAVTGPFGHAAPALVAGLVCISALGAVNGLIFAGARISYAVGRDHRLFRFLGEWHEGRGTPVRALLAQGAISLLLVLALGGFIESLIYTAAPVYLFYTATTFAVLVLRRKEPDVRRPFRVWGYPITPLVFCAVCMYLAYSAVKYKPAIALVALGLLLAGLPVFAWSRRSIDQA
jgi:basic amino acid/polyamine antiporter, APA family